MNGPTVLSADLSHNCAMEVQVDELYDILWLDLLLRVVLGERGAGVWSPG